MKLLVISGGRHPYEESTPVLNDFLQAAGHEVQTINSGNHYLGEVAAIKTDLTLLWFYSDDMRADIVATALLALGRDRGISIVVDDSPTRA